MIENGALGTLSMGAVRGFALVQATLAAAWSTHGLRWNRHGEQWVNHTGLAWWEPTTPLDLLFHTHAGEVGAAQHYSRLLHKLRGGQKITILAVGSSIVGQHGGCTAPAPALKACKCPHCCGSGCTGSTGGWARGVVARLRRTWPQSEYVLYNMGTPGGSIIPSLLACPSTYLNFALDVVLVDMLTVADKSVQERFVRMMLARREAPLLLLTDFFVNIVERDSGSDSNGRVCPPDRGGGGGDTPQPRASSEPLVAHIIRREPLLVRSTTEAVDLFYNGSLRSMPFFGTVNSLRAYHGRVLHARMLWGHYGLPVASTFGAYGAAFADGRISACELHGGSDGTHPGAADPPCNRHVTSACVSLPCNRRVVAIGSAA